MDAKQLWDTTMNPATRKLKRIEIEDAIMADSTTSVLMGNDVPARRQLIMSNGNFDEII